MGRLPWVAIPFLLAACAGPLPSPDPQKAWVDLETTGARSLLMAERLDGKRLNDGRYFQVSPGAHELEASFRFEYSGGLLTFEPLEILCYLRLRYADFAAGERYRLRAWALASQVRAELADARGRELAEAEVQLCSYW